MTYRIQFAASKDDVAAEEKAWHTLTDALDRQAVESTCSEVATRPGSSRTPILLLPPALGARFTQRGARSGASSHPWSETSLGQLATTDCRHVVVISSARAQGLSYRNPGFLDETTKRATKNVEARAWRAFEKAVREACATNPHQPLVTILRCAPSLELPDPFGGFFRKKSLMTWLGFDPPIQLLSTQELVRVLIALAKEAIPDQHADQAPRQHRQFYVAPDDAERLSSICRRLGIRRLVMPSAIHTLAGKTSTCDVQLRGFLRRTWTVSNRALLKQLNLPSLGRMQGSVPAASSTTDSFGFDQATVARLSRWVLEPARRFYWRVESRGVEAFPKAGPTLLVGIHRGYLPIDAMMFHHLVARASGRFVRTLIHPALVKMPWFSIFLPAIGGRIAAKSNAERVLEDGGVLGVLPEGAGSAMIETKNAYPLQPFLSIEFARLAVRFNAPIVPVAAIGPAEALPVFKRINWRWWRKASGWPTLPIGFLFPFGPPIPLPSKWHIVFLEPITPLEVDGKNDEARAQALAQLVQQRIGSRLESMLAARKSRWRGNVL